jgi:hypothetical protein
MLNKIAVSDIVNAISQFQGLIRERQAKYLMKSKKADIKLL